MDTEAARWGPAMPNSAAFAEIPFRRETLVFVSKCRVGVGAENIPRSGREEWPLHDVGVQGSLSPPQGALAKREGRLGAARSGESAPMLGSEDAGPFSRSGPCREAGEHCHLARGGEGRGQLSYRTQTRAGRRTQRALSPTRVA